MLIEKPDHCRVWIQHGPVAHHAVRTLLNSGVGTLLITGSVVGMLSPSLLASGMPQFVSPSFPREGLIFSAGTTTAAMELVPTVSSLGSVQATFELTLLRTLGTSGSCSTAFHVSTDTFVQVACQTNNVGPLSILSVPTALISSVLGQPCHYLLRLVKSGSRMAG
jgi:hypothetical protein